jgi:hypothetical protein
MENLIKLNRRRWAAQLALTTGLALLFLAALLWGLQGVTPARADPGTLYVDGATGSDDSDCSNPADPCATIGYALTRAGNGDEIRVAEGTYTETLGIGITVTLKGGYTVSGTVWLPRSGETVVDADGADDAAIWINANANVTVESFAVQGANHISDVGGGFFIDRATAVVSDTVIRNNSGLAGGGIWVEKWVGYPGNLSLINSSLLTNTASTEGGGGLNSWGAIVMLDNVDVRGNSAPNGQSGGIHVWSGSTVNVVDSIIADNSTRDHGGAATIGPGATLNLTNTLITGNSTTSGVANVFGVDGDVTIMNSTISDNNPQGDQAVILWSGHLTITNSILWNNALSLHGDPPCPTCFTVSYSDIEGGWTGTGNSNTAPLFVGEGDYHLQVGSPCIDKGTLAGAPTRDIEGTPRDATPDMGAYEWTGFRIFLPLTLSNIGP